MSQRGFPHEQREPPEDGPHNCNTVTVATASDSLEPTSEDSPIAVFLEKRGPGLHHLCLASDDLMADDGRLRAAGYRLLRPEPTRGAGGCWVQFVHPKSSGGVLIELSQKIG